MTFERVTLRNGRAALRDATSGEIMHPSVGPWAEANLLYVDQSHLRERLERGPVRVYDVGLGGAANAAAALTCAAHVPGSALELVSFDCTTEPLEVALSDPNGFPFLSPWRDAAHALLNEGTWSVARTRWRLLTGDLPQTLSAAPAPADLVFFDPFSPKTNPALWTTGALAQLRTGLNPDGALLLTYSASTATRVSLLLAGFYVGAGAAVGSKAETTVAATRLEDLTAPLGPRWLARWRRSTRRAPHGEPLTESLQAQVERHPQFQEIAWHANERA